MIQMLSPTQDQKSLARASLRQRAVWVVLIVWLTFVIAYSLGAVSYRNQMWPVPQFLDVWGFVGGHPEERTTLFERILNDAGVLPYRYIVPVGPRAYPLSAYEPLEGLPLNDARDPPLVYISEDTDRGYRILVGTFDFENSLHGVVLLDPNGKVQNTWQITQNDLQWPHSPDHLIFPHGFEITKDGSIIVAYDGGNSLTMYDYCGAKQWQLEGGFHHSVDLVGQDSFWTWGNTKRDKPYGSQLMQISVDDGSVLRRFHILEIIAANPEIDILGIRQTESATGAKWAADPFHPNDIDPLPEDLADFYPNFDEGDLLVSLRSLNLIFVVDPQDLKIKWWRQGLGRRQHDPDWNARGSITILNNNMHRRHSGVVEVDPITMDFRTLNDGKKEDFYTWHRGKHQELPSGSILITSTQQGRAFEVATNGAVTFDFHNVFSEEHGSLSVSEAYFVDPNYFRDLPDCAD